MQAAGTIQYGYVRDVALPFEEAIAKTEAVLKTEGFGVLCRIDIQAKLKEKLGVDFPRYVILGACNPPIALPGPPAGNQPRIAVALQRRGIRTGRSGPRGRGGCREDVVRGGERRLGRNGTAGKRETSRRGGRRGGVTVSPGVFPLHLGL